MRWLAFFKVFLVFIAIVVPCFQSRGLDVQQVLLLRAWFGIVVVLMEVPSGHLAYRIGRKRVVVAGCFMLCVDFSVLLFAGGFCSSSCSKGCLGWP